MDTVLIGDHNWQQHVEPTVNGERKRRGLIPRNYRTHPVGHYAAAPPLEAIDFPLIPRSEWSERIKDKAATKSRLSDIRRTGNNGKIIPSLDQNGKGYCWAHSSTSAVMLLRAVMGLPYVGLSAYAIACIIKSYQDEGGWGAQSLQFITDRGVPSEAFWPMQSMSRSNDKPETWANAALHKVTEGWVDLQAAEYDRKLTFDQVGTLLLSNIPVVSDFNWWSHSVCAIDLIDGNGLYGSARGDDGKLLGVPAYELAYGINTEAAGYGSKILNSWGDSWSDQGEGDLTGSKSIPDGAVAPRVVMASAA